MKHRDFIKIMFGFAGIVIIYSFNTIFFLNIKIYNIVSMILFTIVFSQAALWFIDEHEKHPVFDYMLLFFVTFAGINIREKSKFFLFIGAVYLLYLIYYQLKLSSAGDKNIFTLKIIAAASALISIGSFIAMMLVAMPQTVLLIISAVLFISQAAFIKFSKDLTDAKIQKPKEKKS